MYHSNCLLMQYRRMCPAICRGIRMHIFISIAGLRIPSYGLMIALGVVSANGIASLVLKKYKMNFYVFILLEAYAFLGAFLGAKLLYLWTARSEIEWDRLIQPLYFNQLMQGGFVFYGGLIGGLLFILLGGRLHRIDTGNHVRKFVFLLPWMHAFGRAGCFLAGCCYGVEYHGPLSVVFPEGSLAPSGVPLFPVQLAEAFCLMFLVAALVIAQGKFHMRRTVELYLISYSLLRFALEFFRADGERGIYWGLSTSQWISMLILLGTLLYLAYERKRDCGLTAV